MRLALFVAVTPVVLAAGCADPPPPPPFQVAIKVEADPGVPVAGAVVTRNNKPIATTGPDGRATLTLRGTEGDIYDVTVRCPESFQSPLKPTGIKLARLSESKAPEYDVSCPPTMRRVVVAVRADNGPNLPVVYLNRTVARTDISGAAHFALDVAPGTQFQVTLDTTEKSGEKLKPQSPSKPFTVGQRDDVLVFEQRFDVEKPKAIRRPPLLIPTSVDKKR